MILGDSKMASSHFKPPAYFVSREKELSLLMELWQEVNQAKEPRLVFLMGEPGIGKSALCQQFLSKIELQKNAPMIISARCDLYSGGYDVIRDIFMQFFEKGEGMGLTRKELVQAIIQQAPIWFSMLSGFPEFSFLLTIAQSLKVAYEHILKRNQVFEQASVNNQFLRFIKTILDFRNLIVFIDDLHNADHSTLSLIESLSFSLDKGEILFLFASRYSSQITDDRSANPYDEKFKRVISNCISRGARRVDMVSGIDIAEYLQTKYPGLKLSRRILTQLNEKTEGHPLFIEKLMLSWEKSGVIVTRENAYGNSEWILANPSNEIQIPDALSALIESQYSFLAMDLRHLLQVASVQGENFTVQVISSLLSEEALKIILKIQIIEDEYRLIKPYRSIRYQKVVFDFYSFFHGFIQEYIYTYKLDPVSKRQLHSHIGTIMEQLYSEEEIASVSSQLARHFHEGMDYEKAIKYYLKAAEYEQSQYAWDASQLMCREGISIASSVKDLDYTTLIALLVTSAKGYGAVGDYDNVIKQYEKAIDYGIQNKHSGQHIAEMCQVLSDYLDTQLQFSKARKFIDLGFQFLDDSPEDDLLRLCLNARVGRLLSHEKGKGWEAAVLYKSVIKQAENMPASFTRDSLLYETYNYLGSLLNSLSEFDESYDAYKRSAEIAYRVDMAQDARSALLNLAFDIIDKGKFDEALDIATKCHEEGLKSGMLEDQAYSLTIIGAAYASMGDYPTAIEHLTKGISLFDQLGNHWNDPYDYYDLSRAYLGAGDVKAAHDAAMKCLQSAQQTDSDEIDVYEQAVGYEMLARVLAEMGDWSACEENFKKSIKMMRGEGSFFETARAQKYFGLALLKKGDAKRGINLLKTSLSTMKKIKMDYEAHVIREILSQLAE